jgi:hypothetical protein
MSLAPLAKGTDRKGLWPPGAVVVAGVAACLCQIGQLLTVSFHAVALIGAGVTVLGVLLLVAASPVGWYLMMFWAAAAVAGPFVFASPKWAVLAGVVVAGALTTRRARSYCLGPSPASAASVHPVRPERKLAARLTEVVYRIEGAVAPSRIRRLVEERLPRSWLRTRNLFLFFLGATLILLPVSGAVGKLDRNHVAAVSSTLALLGLIVVGFRMLRAVIR